MSLSHRELAKVARLARLALSTEERSSYALELGRILELVGQMDAVDVDAITPMAHPLDESQRLRADEVTEFDQRERFQAVAPAVESGLYLVPRVIE